MMFIIVSLTRNVFPANSLLLYAKSTPVSGLLYAPVTTKLMPIPGRNCIFFNNGLWKKAAKTETKDLDPYMDYWSYSLP
jgi:hypothetical protein